MATFEIDGKEYELKLNYAAVKRLSNLFEGGAYELIGKAIAGDFDLYPMVVHAGLFHTNGNFSVEKIDEEIEELFEANKLDFDMVSKTLDEVVTQSFFFASTVRRMLKDNPAAIEQLEKLRA